MQIKNKLHLLPFFLISYLGLFTLININPVMAMESKLPETSSTQPAHHNLTLKEKIINLKHKIYDNANKIKNNIDKQTKKLLEELIYILDDIAINTSRAFRNTI
ncbi:MAG: putative secreted protein [Candidatus Phytoplasma citri]|nr:MAG: putative secreted protein [Candidatus Phytoplasma aurantifolia]